MIRCSVFTPVLAAMACSILATRGRGAEVGQRLVPGEHERTVRSGGVDRRYRVHVPVTSDPGLRAPLVIAFHGGGGSPAAMIRLSGLNQKADEAGFIVAYPYGTGPFPDRVLSFNGGNCCAHAMRQDADDVGFTRAMLDDLASVASIDGDRVFATGISNGAIMAYRVASELSDRIAAIAPVGGPMGTAACAPTRPVSVMHFHGTADELAPFQGGRGRGAAGGAGVTDFYSVDHSIRNWVLANGCRTEPEVVALPDSADDGTRVARKTWGGGRDDSEVVLVEIEGGGHTWPGMDPPVAFLGRSTKDISANDMMWDFFRKHPRRPVAARRPAEAPSRTHGAKGMKVLRTPDSRFANLPGYDFTPHYLMVDDYEGGRLRMHYVDEGPRGAPTILMLHGNPTWSYLFRELVRPLNAAGYRTVLLDYVGMGRSDKPAECDDYTYDRHLGWIKQAFEQMDRAPGLGKVTIFGHDYGVPFGIRLMAEHYPERFDAFINANASLPVGTRISPTHRRWRQFVRDHPDVPVGNVISSKVDPRLTGVEIAAWNAPYPDASYKMAIRSFPEMVPDSPDRPEAIANTAAWGHMERFPKPLMTIFGKFDAIDLPSARMEFIDRVPGAHGQPHPQLDVTHYAPEDKPEAVAREVIGFLADVYDPRAFARLMYADFETGLDGFADGGDGCDHNAEAGAIRIRGDRGAASSTWPEGLADLGRYGAIKVAFRYRASGMREGEGLVVELGDGSGWVEKLRLSEGVDFRNGARDYGFARIDGGATGLPAEAKIRIRCRSGGNGGLVDLLDVGVYGRARAEGASNVGGVP